MKYKELGLDFMVLPVDLKNFSESNLIQGKTDDVIGFVCLNPDNWGTCQNSFCCELVLVVTSGDEFVVLDSWDFMIADRVRWGMETWSADSVAMWLDDRLLDGQPFKDAGVDGYQFRR